MSMKRWGKCKKCGMQKVAFFKEFWIDTTTMTSDWHFTCGNCGHAPRAKKGQVLDLITVVENKK